ncbi:hypothetical protein EVAR_17037_1 [Eumeta japonica]|uniref:Uncharacterized protein n=1 Tax=Eumeta variegata TaxID=151549 RepID=A0A4C1V4J9_EUMVA|nr:hypothetical protein EVAR_17037_1 [Eumeta japonica]
MNDSIFSPLRERLAQLADAAISLYQLKGQSAATVTEIRGVSLKGCAKFADELRIIMSAVTYSVPLYIIDRRWEKLALRINAGHLLTARAILDRGSMHSGSRLNYLKRERNSTFRLWTCIDFLSSRNPGLHSREAVHVSICKQLPSTIEALYTKVNPWKHFCVYWTCKKILLALKDPCPFLV